MAIHQPLGNQQTGNQAPGQSIRQTMLQVVEEYNKIGPGYFQAGPILNEVAKRCGARSTEQQQAVLTVWNDLFRSGLLGEGYDLSNPSMPFCHLTSRGRDPVSEEAVHASLLIFPELAQLISELEAWIGP